VRGRIVLRIVVLVVAVAVVAWRNFGGNIHRDETAAGSTSARASAEAPTAVSSAPTPLPTRHWQLGTLMLESCELPRRLSGASTAAWCTDFDVAEDPVRPEGRHIRLHLAVIRADAAEADPDLVVMLAGGPGEAATESFADTGWYAEVRKHHNVLLLDQRGTGHSHPLSCDKTAERLTAESLRAEGGDSAVPDADVMRQRVADCLAEVRQNADPRDYTTTIAVGDLEKVREALGAPELDLFGVSYGTRVAQQYLMRHPDAVRSVVLDSPAPNQLILGSEWAANLEAALKKDFDACTATAACKQAYGDPMHTLYALRDALRADPHEVSFRDPRSYETVSRMLTASSLATVVRMFAYSPETAALLPLSIDAAAHGNVGPLLGQERLLTYDLSGDMNGGMAMSVVCSEDADQLHERPEDADTILGNTVIESIETQCGVWPHGAMPDDFHAPLESDTPVLIFSGERDPVTPPKYGAEIMKGLTHARHFVLKGQGHAVFGRGCVPKLIAQFIDDPEPERLDARCLDRLRPTPPFIDFNGASP
jgi:pimeloyl-ACP methyl ester carboxylesterase